MAPMAPRLVGTFSRMRLVFTRLLKLWMMSWLREKMPEEWPTSLSRASDNFVPWGTWMPVTSAIFCADWPTTAADMDPRFSSSLRR